eukprot:Sdes_comp23233_c0_seq1m21519
MRFFLLGCLVLSLCLLGGTFGYPGKYEKATCKQFQSTPMVNLDNCTSVNGTLVCQDYHIPNFNGSCGAPQEKNCMIFSYYNSPATFLPLSFNYTCHNSKVAGNHCVNFCKQFLAENVKDDFMGRFVLNSSHGDPNLCNCEYFLN